MDHCTAIDAVVRGGKLGRTYNVGGHNEMANLNVVHLLCDLVDEFLPGQGSRRELITFVTDRPGHDQRYAIDASRMSDELDWNPSVTFAEGLRASVRWYLDNEAWCAEVTGDQYAGERLGLK